MGKLSEEERKERRKAKDRERARRRRESDPGYHKRWRDANKGHLKAYRQQHDTNVLQEYYKEYRLVHKAKQAAYNVEWRKINRERIKNRNRKREYGITPEEWKRLYDGQGGTCAICCGRGEPKGLCVDHDHVTGRVRGLLCNGCNTAIGTLGDG